MSAGFRTCLPLPKLCSTAVRSRNVTVCFTQVASLMLLRVVIWRIPPVT